MADGTSGNDTFTAPAGSSTFNGLGGTDTIIFNFRLIDATVTWVGNQVIVDTSTSHTVLTGFETYQFTDGTVNDADGNPLVDDLYYYATYHDLWNAHIDADTHYNTVGWKEGRNPDAFFNTKLYLSLNPDVAKAGLNPLLHFDSNGWKEGRDPSGNFDLDQYLAANPDVKAAGGDPLAQFLAFGAGEGRQPFDVTTPFTAVNGFDYIYYFQHNPDVVASGADLFQHYENFGWKEGRNPNAFFDVSGYLATYGDVKAAGLNPLDHFHNSGWTEGRLPSPAFDGAAYLAHNADVAAAHIDPLEHYLRFGINEGRAIYAAPILDNNGAANGVVEGAAAGTLVGVTVSWANWTSPNLFYSIGSDPSGGGFTINATTGVISVADGTKIDFESNASHSYVVTVVAHDGTNTSSQNFTINIADAAPVLPTSAAPIGNVFELAANGTSVGITVVATDPNGPAAVYTLTDNAGGRFAIDSSTGVVTVANGAAVDYETAPGQNHSYSITAQATVGAQSVSETLTINVGNINEAPQGADHTVTALEDTVYNFTLADFGFSDTADAPASNSFKGAFITSIAGAGQLLNHGVAVAVNDFISAADITGGHVQFMPTADDNGAGYASFQFKVQDDGGTANGGQDTDTTARTMTIDVAAVNDQPSFNVTNVGPLLEDAGAQTLNAFANGISAGPANEAGQTLTFTTTNDNNALFSVQPFIDGSGNLTFTPAADANGSTTVTVKLQDDGGTANGGQDTTFHQFTITVTAVNDAPSFTLGASPDQFEDAGAITVAGFAGSISAGPSDESGQVLNFIVNNNNNALFSVQPSIDPLTGNLTYTLAADANGSATVTVQLHDDGGTANGGVDTSAPQTFIINVDAVNDAPAFTLGADQAVLEDSGAHTVNGFATGISAGPANEAGQALTFTTTNDNNTLFSVQPTIDAAGNLTYTLAADANGSATVTVKLQDNGGIANGGVDTTTHTFQINATAVNDAPSFTLGANQAVQEDDGAITVSAFATSISAGPSDESGQALNFIVNNNNNALFSVQPSIDPLTGNLTYTLAADANGGATVTVQLHDDGGTANGGADTSAPQTFVITVNSVNDAPTAANLTQSFTITEDAAATNLFSAPLPTVADIDSATVNAVLTVAAASGTLTGAGVAVVNGTDLVYTINGSPAAVQTQLDAVQFTPAADFNGSATVHVAINDGPIEGPQGTNPSGDVTITIDAVNDAPTLTATGGTHTYAAGVDLFSSVTAAAGPADESTQHLTQLVLTVSNVSGANTESLSIDGGTVDLVDGAVSTGTPHGTATVTVDNGTHVATVTFGGTLTPADVQSIVDGLSYTNTNGSPGDPPRTITITSLQDDGGTANGGHDTATLNVAATVVFDIPPDTTATSATGNEDTTILVTLSGTDADGTVQSFAITALPLHGTLFSDPGLTQQIPLNGQVTAAANAATVYFVPSANYNGGDTFQYASIDNVGVQDQTPATATVTVNAVNDAPSFTLPSNATSSSEDAGAQTVNGFVTSISPGPADESGQTVSFVVTGNDNAGLFSTGPAIDASGNLTYTAAANANGTATITFHAHDNGGTANGGVDNSGDQTFTVTVNAVNDAPTFSLPVNTTSSNEDAGAQSVSGFVTSISPGPANEAGQNVSFVVTNDSNAGLFSVGPAIDATGKLTYTAAANVFGSATITFHAHDDGGTANGGVDNSGDQTFTITVNSVADAPSGQDKTINPSLDTTLLEDGSYTLTASDFGFSDPNDSAGPGGANNFSAVVFVSVPAAAAGTLKNTNTNTTLANGATVTISDINNGFIKFFPAANKFGSAEATATFKVQDDGSTANGGVNTDPTAHTLTFNVTGVNDAPTTSNHTIDPALDATLLEDHSYTFQLTDFPFSDTTDNPSANNFANVIITSLQTAGSLQLNGSAVTVNQVIAASEITAGHLVFTPAADANGSAYSTFGFKVEDDGGTANGGQDTSAAATMTINVTPVNDVPSFTKGANQSVNEDSGAVSVTNWATALSAGPANEASQTLNFIVSNNNNAMFTVQPTISATGTLTYTIASNYAGTATVSVQIHDNGGTANGGVDTSAVQTFVIDASPVADAPTFTFNLTPIAFTNEAKADTTTAGIQNAAAVTALSGGRYVVAWQNTAISNSNTRAQIYNSDGTPVGSEIALSDINAETDANSLSLNGLSAGSFVGGFLETDVRQDLLTGNGSIEGRIFNSSGSLVGSAFQISDLSTGAVGDLQVTRSSAAVFSDGSFVVVWEHVTTGTRAVVDAQRFTSAGVAVHQDGTTGGRVNFQVSSAATGVQELPDVAVLGNNNFVVAWTSTTQDSDGSAGIFYQVYNSAGTAVGGGEHEANSTTANTQSNVTLTELGGGGFAIAWTSVNQVSGSSQGDIYVRLFNASGTATSSEILVNTTTTGAQDGANIVALPDGGFLVTWNSDQDAGGSGVFGQRLDASGNKIGTEFLVNQTTAGAQQQHPPSDRDAAAVLNSGKVVMAWDSNQVDGGDIYSRQFSVPGDGPQGGPVTVATITAAVTDLVGTTPTNGGQEVITKITLSGIPTGQGTFTFSVGHAGATADLWVIDNATDITNLATTPLTMTPPGGYHSFFTLGVQVTVTDTATLSGGDVTDTLNTAIKTIPIGVKAPGDPIFAADSAGTFALHLDPVAPGDSVTITSLPGNGDLTLGDGTPVAANAKLTADQFASLKFTPVDVGADTSATLQFTVSDGTSDTANTVPINLVHGTGVTLVGSEVNDHLIGSPGDDVLGGGPGRDMLTGGTGADAFVFDHTALADATAAAPQVDHVTDYSAPQGDTLDFSALIASLGSSGAAAAIHVNEDAGGQFATVQLAYDQSGAHHAVNVVVLDGVHVGDAVNVAVDSHTTLHLQANWMVG